MSIISQAREQKNKGLPINVSTTKYSAQNPAYLSPDFKQFGGSAVAFHQAGLSPITGLPYNQTPTNSYIPNTSSSTFQPTTSAGSTASTIAPTSTFTPGNWGAYQAGYDALSPEEKVMADKALGNSYMGNGVNLGDFLTNSITQQQNAALEPKYTSDVNTAQQSLANDVNAIQGNYGSDIANLKSQEALDNRARSLDDASTGMFSSTARNLRLNSFTNSYNNKYNQLYNNANQALTNKVLGYGNVYGSENTPSISLEQYTRTPNEYNTGNVTGATINTIKPYGQQNNALINRQNEAKSLAKQTLGKLLQNKNIQ